MAAALRIDEVPLGDSRLVEFVRFPWRLYRGDPCWTPPLDADLLGSRILGVKGLLTAEHPYHDDAEVTHFIATRSGEVVGMVSAAINRAFDEYHGDRFGFFGFFEVVEDYEVAEALLDTAKAWCIERGARIFRGPGQYSCATHERQGVLVEGFEWPPTVELTHNAPYYAEFCERYGLAKAMDYVAYRFTDETVPIERLRRVAAAVAERERITTRPADVSNFTEEVRLVVRLYNEAWKDNWGFLPVSQGEADVLAETLRPIVDPGLVRFAYHDGEPVGVIGGIPDPYWALRPRWLWYGDGDAVRLARLLATRRRIPRVRLMFFGIRPEARRIGVDVALFAEAAEHALARGVYHEAEPSMLLETNTLIRRAAADFGGVCYKRWRIYECEL